MTGAQGFTWRSTNDGRIVIGWGGRTVTTLAGKRAGRFLAEVEDAADEAAQLLLARATSNFKRGNER